MRKKDYPVVQSNYLIEAQYKLDVLPQKLIRHLVSKIMPDHATFKDRFYKLTVKEFTNLIGRESEGSMVAQMKKAARALRTVELTIKRPEKTIYASWIASYAHYHSEGWFEFEFSARLERELLLIKDQFTEYHMANVAKLKSQYAIRLYELLKQYLSIGYRTIPLEELKPILGIDKRAYPLYNNFRTKVLDIANRDINSAKTDMEFQWKPVRRLRKIIAIEFYGIRKKERQLPDWVRSLLPPEYLNHGDTVNNIFKWLDLKGDKHVREKLEYTVSMKPINFASYLFKALENDYIQKELPVSHVPERDGFEFPKDGMQIRVEDGTIYTIEDGHIHTESGVIPKGTITQGIKSGKLSLVHTGVR